MQTFWSNVNRFPRFLIGVIIGFFLTTFYPIFKSLKNKKQLIFINTLFLITLYLVYRTLILMLAIN
uniref:Uncharacterized protein ycf33 n=1 Tax=Pterocladia lucida TaxID=31408 RepID=A0A6M3WW14_PTELU|nr:Ycf33 [Pterocladia lucida]